MFKQAWLNQPLSALALALLLTNTTVFSVNAATTAVHTAPAAEQDVAWWKHGTVYFVLTDRFVNGDKANDAAYGRQKDGAPLRYFMGGDFAGITQKIRDGYFNALGVSALWITPPVEQIHGYTDEGTGKSYGFHGYWARDFTTTDQALGSEDAFREMVDAAHDKGIRVLLDVVMNHVGPVTAQDSAWPQEWVRDEPVCSYRDIPSTVSCALVKGLPDLRTETLSDVKLPPFLINKWQQEGRLQQQMQNLDVFFQRYRFPRAPRYYLMSWHADWIRRFGIDGFRADTVKHVEPELWAELKQVASDAYAEWKQNHPQKVRFRSPFYMVGEAYGYGIQQGKSFHMDGGSKLALFDAGFDALINFSFRSDISKDAEAQFSEYQKLLSTDLKGVSVLNYLASHDDEHSFDRQRKFPLLAAERLLLSPGAAQIYYGDESGRNMDDPDAAGDAKLRSPMNWDDLAQKARIAGIPAPQVLRHWQLLGQFRQRHPAIGAGVHQQISATPYVFSRRLNTPHRQDQVVVVLGAVAGQRVFVGEVFPAAQSLRDFYSKQILTVKDGYVTVPSASRAVLLEGVNE